MVEPRHDYPEPDLHEGLIPDLQRTATVLADERKAIARELWAKARLMEKRGDDQTVGMAAMDEDERARAMSRSSSFYGQVTAFENAAWLVLGRSGVVDADFFNATS
jgi:hypothetical protein